MAQPPHHEHIVRINDPANVAGAWLTREQLWAGLLHTVLAPELLDESIDSASIHEIGPSRLRREIRRGRCATTRRITPRTSSASSRPAASPRASARD